MYSSQRIIANLAAFVEVYTNDLEQPFHENISYNESAETSMYIYNEVCDALGMSQEQKRRVLGETGTAFIEYLGSDPIEITMAEPAEPAWNGPTINLFGAKFEFWGEVRADSTTIICDRPDPLMGGFEGAK